MKTLTAYDILNIDGAIYYVCNEFNALIKYENTDQHELVSDIPDEGIYAQALVSQIFCVDKRIILIPLNAKKIWIYHLEQKMWKGIEIENPDCDYKFLKAVKFENKIYLLPSRYRKIVVLDVVSNEIEYIDIRKGMDNKIGGVYFRNDIVIHGSIIYAAYCSGGYVFKFDMSNLKYEWIEIVPESDGFSGIAYAEDKFWLSARNDSRKIYVWDGNAICKEIIIESEKKAYSRGIYIIDKKIYVKKENKTLVIDINDLNKISERNVSYIYVKKTKEGEEYLTYDGEYICCLEEMTKSVKLVIEEKDREKFIKERITTRDAEYFMNRGIVQEKRDFDLSDFLILMS
ncbi:hypothetical protein SAMN02910451_00968 [Butyrivibrio hungatei]|uniref:Uncharacterized protein n=1 Tax=Butyrivibrio hungatei TaxID=185008 RepID=A0A1G5C8B6_9FIRM|nr:hypothetical protein [Butyrivibrio hungatei]SCX98586.1 hypothetical protein SAMN02910451_00968 [Butyrivibrio hungatei]